MRCALAFLLLAGLAACRPEDDVPRPLVLQTHAVAFSRNDPSRLEAGRLLFRGGLELHSKDPDFGGLSGLVVSPDGSSFVAVSDQAHWITGGLDYGDDGNLTDVHGQSIAPLLDREGRPMAGKDGDAEGLAFADDTDPFRVLFVSFEGRHRVWRYEFGRDGVSAVPTATTLPPDAVAAPLNAGIEGLTRSGDGRLLAFSERYPDTFGNYRGWVLPLGPAPGAAAALRLRPSPPFSITDARLLPDGDLLTLERRFDPVNGVGMQMRRIRGGDLQRAVAQGPAVLLDGEVVANLDPGYEIDNMEGLSVRRGPRGETLLYVVSDDNFQRTLQSTLLLMFELRP